MYYIFLPDKLNVYYLKFQKYYVLITLNKKYFWFPLDGNLYINYNKELSLLYIKSL